MPYGIEEALNALGATALVQKRIDPLVNELQRRYAPLLQAIPSEAWDSTVYNWDTRTKLPAAGPVTDGGTRPVAQSKYTQTAVTIRNLLAVGSVTGYAEAVTRSFGSLRGREIIGAIKNMNWAVETQIGFGNSAATGAGGYPEFDGLDTLCSVTSGTKQNVVNLAGATFSLAMFDQVIDLVENNVSESIFGDDWMFVVSPTLESKASQLMQQFQRYMNLAQATVAAGLNVVTYRDIPIVKSTFLSARSGAMGAVALTSAATGGSIGTGHRYYKVSAVINSLGETAPCAEQSITIASGTTNTVKISFTPPSTPDTSPVLLYKVWEGSATGTETLLGVVDGTVGLAANGVTPIVTTSIVDTGAALVPHNGTTVPATLPAAYYGRNATMKPQPANGQDFYLVSRNPAYIKRPYVRTGQPVPNLAPTVLGPDQLPYALVTDTALALRMSTFIGRGRSAVVNLA